MANKIVKGQNYRAARFRSGNSERGPWELIVVLDERNKNDITIYPAKIPSGVVEGQQFLVADIIEMSNGFRKDNKGVWVSNVTAKCDVSPIRSEFDDIPESEFKAVDIDSDDPWGNVSTEDVGDLPF